MCWIGVATIFSCKYFQDEKEHLNDVAFLQKNSNSIDDEKGFSQFFTQKIQLSYFTL